jgi:hypothetical protein
VVGVLIPDGFIGLAVGHPAEAGTIDPGQDPPVDNNVINKLRERLVVAAHRQLLRQRGEIGVGGRAIIEVGPDLVVRLIEAAVEVAQHDKGRRPLGRRIDPTLQDGHLRQQRLAGRAGRGVLETPALQTD